MIISTSSNDLALVDTNILIDAVDSESRFHPVSKDLLSAEHGLCVVPQTLAEFYSVVTNPRRVRSPKVPHEAASLIQVFLDRPNLFLLSTPADVVRRWIELLRRHPVTGHAIFDRQLVATMLGNGVTRIYTFNESDFEPFDEIEVIRPQSDLRA